jgi:hypothetical protein
LPSPKVQLTESESPSESDEAPALKVIESPVRKLEFGFIENSAVGALLPENVLRQPAKAVLTRSKTTSGANPDARAINQDVNARLSSILRTHGLQEIVDFLAKYYKIIIFIELFIVGTLSR